MQILPAIDLRGGKCVRLRQGDYDRETVFSDDPVEVARRFASEGAERLHLVDLDGARAGRPVNHALVRRIGDAAGIPCELGGGIRDNEAVARVLDETGIDRAVIGTQALKRPEWFRAVVRRFPGRVALGLDARDGMVSTDGWLDVSEVRALDLARRYADLDLAAVIYTNIANDGMMQGLDDATLDDLAEVAGLGLPVIASGGVTTVDDVRRLAELARQQPHLQGVIVGRAFYEGTLSVAEAVRAAKNVE